MKALTVYQPWASLECLGLKGTETRGWATSYRGELAIHAGKKWTAELAIIAIELHAWLVAHGSVGLPYNPPRGVILAVATLADCVQVTEDNQTMFSEFDRVAGDCRVGRWIWILEDVRPLEHPVPCPGAQGLWTVPGRQAEMVRRQLLRCPAVARV